MLALPTAKVTFCASLDSLPFKYIAKYIITHLVQTATATSPLFIVSVVESSACHLCPLEAKKYINILLIVIACNTRK